MKYIIKTFCLHCKLRNLVTLWGQQFIETQPVNPRPHAFFRKNMFQKALNRVLTLPKARARRELSIGVIYANRASICVELRPFYCSKRILVPMSYISFFDIANACQGKPIKKLINSGKYPKWFYEEKMNTVYCNCDYSRRLAFY